MKVQNYLCLLAATLIVVPSYGAIVSSPWSPDGGLGTGEKNLYELIGMSDSSKPNTLQITADEIWSTAIGNQFTTLVIEQAGNLNNNAFGVYEIGNTANKLEIFPGSANGDINAPKSVLFDSVFNTITLGSSSITVSGGSFGFYLARGGSYPTFYSQASLNPATADQMVTYDINNTKYGPNTGWLLAWEDLNYASSDKDFNDMIVTLTASPIPEPTTVIAGALLLLPFGASTIRFLRKSRTA